MSSAITPRPDADDVNYEALPSQESIRPRPTSPTDRHNNSNNNNDSVSYDRLFEDNELDLSLRPESTLAIQDATTSFGSSPTVQAGAGSLDGRPEETASPVQTDQPKHTSWGITWQSPVFIIATLLAGLALSLGHHCYYLTLSGTAAGDAAKQAWPVRFGTAFAFLVCATFKATTAAAIQQYVWTIVRQGSLTLCERQLSIHLSQHTLIL